MLVLQLADGGAGDRRVHATSKAAVTGQQPDAVALEASKHIRRFQLIEKVKSMLAVIVDHHNRHIMRV